jgi:hypothetical protein
MSIYLRLNNNYNIIQKNGLYKRMRGTHVTSHIQNIQKEWTPMV